MPRTTLLVVCTLLVVSMAFLVGTAVAQTDELNVNYFSNANTSGAPDGTVRVTNPGTSGGNLCADIYVFDPDEEMSECCSCLTTPDGLLTLSVDSNLTSNPLTGAVLTTGVIKIVSAAPANAPSGQHCPLPTSIVAVPALREWGTHIQNSSYTITETEFLEATLSKAEGLALQNECRAIQAVGSGKGVCANTGALTSICNF